MARKRKTAEQMRDIAKAKWETEVYKRRLKMCLARECYKNKMISEDNFIINQQSSMYECMRSRRSKFFTKVLSLF